ncbi:hypothetical protein DXG01_001175 [Tephrocybe rancida]|nr:hypothetical protein DXG01_001175 [Tephrocybe rancida]
MYDMYYTRGAASDFDRYANETGDPGWSWKNLQPYILKKWTAPVDNHNTSGQFNPLLHGLNGTVSVSLAALPQAIASRTLQTTQELSDEFPFNLDMNSGKPLGVGWLQTTIDKGQRSSSATAYLSPDVLRRPNLHVVVNTHVTRILKTNDVKGQPVLQGVEVAESSNSIRQNLYASKEVILSAGTIGTPHILLNSGIGDKSELKAFGVKLVLHLPGVGKNFTEMPAIANNWRISSNDTFDDLQRNASVRAQDLQQWQRNKTGPLALTTATHLIYRRVPANSTVFQNETDPSSSVDAPHYEIFTVNGAFGPTPPEGHYIGLVSIVVNPTSRGSVTLNSSDPFQQPLINPGVLDSEFDKFAIREAVKASSRFLEAPAWKDYVVAPIAGLENVTTDAELDEYITQSTVIALHGVGTAQMTAKHASYGVVDPDLCLKGASGLRIVDASVFVRFTFQLNVYDADHHLW